MTKMREKLEFLKEDKARGEAAIADLNRKRGELQEAVLRIDGAIIMLEEMIAENPEEKKKP